MKRLTFFIMFIMLCNLAAANIVLEEIETSTDFGRAHTLYRIFNNGTEDLNSSILNTISKDYIINSGHITRSWLERQVNITKTRNIANYQSLYLEYDCVNNQTLENETCVFDGMNFTGYTKQNYTEIVWTEIDNFDGLTLPAGQTFEFYHKARIDMNGGSMNIDNIICVDELDGTEKCFTEYAWWNNSWLCYHAINISATQVYTSNLTDYIADVNFTSVQNYKSARIIYNDTDIINYTVVDYNGDDSNASLRLFFPINYNNNSVNNMYKLYACNSGLSTFPSYDDEPFRFSQTFDESLDSLKSKGILTANESCMTVNLTAEYMHGNLTQNCDMVMNMTATYENISYPDFMHGTTIYQDVYTSSQGYIQAQIQIGPGIDGSNDDDSHRTWATVGPALVSNYLHSIKVGDSYYQDYGVTAWGTNFNPNQHMVAASWTNGSIAFYQNKRDGSVERDNGFGTEMLNRFFNGSEREFPYLQILLRHPEVNNRMHMVYVQNKPTLFQGIHPTITVGDIVELNNEPVLKLNNTYPDSPITYDNISFNITCTDQNALDTITGYLEIYKNDVSILTTSTVVSNGTETNLYTLNYQNTTYGDNITGQYWCGDTKVNTSKSNDTVTIAANNLPLLTYNNTYPNVPYQGEDIYFNATCTDADLLDNLTGYVEVYKNGVSLVSVSVSVSNGTETLIYTLGSGNVTGGDNVTGQYWCGDGTANTSKSNDTVTVSSNTMTIDIIFQNESGTEKTLFDEGEDILIYLNVSVNGAYTNDTNCSIDLAGGIVSQDASNSNFSMCTSCDYSLYSENVTFHSSDNVINDSVHFYACHETTPARDINVSISCNNSQNIYTELILASEYPTCTVGDAFVEVKTDICADFLNMTVTLSFDEPVAFAKRIVNMEFDREYSLHQNFWQEDIFYNESLNLYYSDHDHEYYIHGTKYINATCIDPLINDTVSETIVIVNIAPTIDYSGVFAGGNFQTPDTPISIYEYYYGIWRHSISVSDDDLAFAEANFYLSNGSLYFTTTNFSDAEHNSTSYADFAGNTFNISVFANDSFGNITTASFLFNVTDTISPVCSGINNVTGIEDTNQNISFSCYDEALFSVNLTCVNLSISNYTEYNALQNYTFDFLEVFNMTEFTCQVEACDGHLTADDCVTYNFEGITGVAPATEVYEVGVCPTDTPGVILLGFFILIGLFLIYMGIMQNVGVFGFFGSLLILIMTWFFAGCSQLLAMIIAGIMIIMMGWFVFIKPIMNNVKI